MKYTLAILATVASVAMATPATAADTARVEAETKVSKDSEGNYKKTHSETSKDSAGTKVSTDTKIEVDADSDGDVTKTVTTKSSTDPKGLLNKKTTKTTDKIKYTKDKTKSEHKKIVDGRTVEEESAVIEHNTNARANY